MSLRIVQDDLMEKKKKRNARKIKRETEKEQLSSSFDSIQKCLLLPRLIVHVRVF